MLFRRAAVAGIALGLGTIFVACAENASFGGSNGNSPALQNNQAQGPAPATPAAAPVPVTPPADPTPPATEPATPPAPATPVPGPVTPPAVQGAETNPISEPPPENLPVPPVFAIVAPPALNVAIGSSNLPDVGEKLVHDFATEHGEGAVTFAFDLTPASAHATLTGAHFEFEPGVDEAGTYNLKVTATDAAQHTAEITVAVKAAPIDISLVSSFTQTETVTEIKITEPFHPDRRYVMNDKFQDLFLAKSGCENLVDGVVGTSMPEFGQALPVDAYSQVGGVHEHLFTRRITKEQGDLYDHYIVYSWVHFTATGAKPILSMVETCVSNAAADESLEQCRQSAYIDGNDAGILKNLYYCADYLNGNAVEQKASFYTLLYNDFVDRYNGP